MRILQSVRSIVWKKNTLLLKNARLSSHIRNVGIFAHIDAGKTTTSEAILYLCGATRSVGLVDSGDTVMDFLPQEKERGITISAAAVSCGWKGYTINLIDTPGHVDFTMEVERTSRVLDGSVLVVDAVAGVQAQTKTVWRAISKRALPSIAFINKMDRIGANWQQSIQSIEEKLNIRPQILQYPILSPDGEFHKVIDLISWKVLEWAPSAQKGTPSEIICRDMNNTESQFEIALEVRKQLFDSIADYDEDFMTLVLENDYENIAIPDVIKGLRKACLSREFLPVLFGSALRGKGVQPLLDAMVAFLPSPSERPNTLLKHRSTGEVLELQSASEMFCALAFKVLHNHNRGVMVYARVYSGAIQSKQSLYNSTVQKEERINQILSIQADELSMIDKADAGSVVCLIGLKNTKTGDTLLSMHNNSKLKSFELEGLTIPKPVYSIAIEPENESQRKGMEQALSYQCLEDPSLSFEVNQESGQTLVKGLGELHLDIVVDKLKRQYRLPVFVSQTYIGYRESLDIDSAEEEYVYDFVREGKRNYAKVTLQITRRADNDECKASISDKLFSSLKAEEINTINEVLANSLKHGSKGYPIIGLNITLQNVETQDLISLRACLALCMQKLMSQQGVHQLLEPVMEVEIHTPSAYMGEIIQDLTSVRRGELKEVKESSAGVLIAAEVPLQALIGYATQLRSKSHGEAAFSAEYHSHKVVT